MKFATYFFISLSSLIGVIAYAIHSREQFYPVILFLTNSKVSFLVWGNMIIAMAVLIGKIIKSLFLGSLREAELELLIERAKFSIFETCLALTVFRNELSAPILLFFGLLLFVKSFHWLAKSRFEYLEQVMPLSSLSYFRYSGLLITLFIADVLITYHAANFTIKYGKSVVMLFGFEFGLLVVSVFNLSSRYILLLLDNRFTNGLPSKGLYVMIIDLICEAFKCVIYIAFFFLLFSNYGLPIHIVREVWLAFHNFQRKLMSFLKYLRLTNNLDSRFPNATPEEITAAGDCLICREAMDCGKKLPCSHVFHLDCLRMWLQHQQSCPLCRADIPSEADAAVLPIPQPLPPGHIPAENGIPDDVDDLARHPPHVNQADIDPTATPNSLRTGHDRPNLSNQSMSDLVDNIERLHSPSKSFMSPVGNAMASLEVPNLFIIRSSEDIPVRVDAKLSSATVRTIRKNSIVFIKDVKSADMMNPGLWFAVSGGWLCEKNFDGSYIKLEPLTSEAIPTTTSRSIHDADDADFSKLLGSHMSSSSASHLHQSSSNTQRRDHTIASEDIHPGQASLTSSPYTRPSKKPSMKGPVNRSYFPSFSSDIPDYPDDLDDRPIQTSYKKPATNSDMMTLLHSNIDIKKKLHDLNIQLDQQMRIIERMLENASIKEESDTRDTASAIETTSVFEKEPDSQASLKASIREMRANLLERKEDSTTKVSNTDEVKSDDSD